MGILHISRSMILPSYLNGLMVFCGFSTWREQRGRPGECTPLTADVPTLAPPWLTPGQADARYHRPAMVHHRHFYAVHPSSQTMRTTDPCPETSLAGSIPADAEAIGQRRRYTGAPTASQCRSAVRPALTVSIAPTVVLRGNTVGQPVTASQFHFHHRTRRVGTGLLQWSIAGKHQRCRSVLGCGGERGCSTSGAGRSRRGRQKC